MVPAEFKVQVVLLAAFAFVFVVLAWCLQRNGAGRWAPLGAAGAGLMALSFGLEAAVQVESVFFDSFHIFEEVLIREHAFTVVTAAKALGAVLLAWAFVEARRTPPAAPLYGPPA